MRPLTIGVSYLCGRGPTHLSHGAGSFWFQATTMQTHLERNVHFNGPRAGRTFSWLAPLAFSRAPHRRTLVTLRNLPDAVVIRYGRMVMDISQFQ